MKKTVNYLFVILILSSAMAACEKEEKMEEMGGKTDEMMENAGDKMKDMGEELKEKVKEAKEVVSK